MKVVIAFIEVNQLLLITRRALNTHFGGFWELPGGKIEVNESPVAALTRELKEELDIEVEIADFICCIENPSVEFYLYHVTCFKGEPALTGQQMDMAWISRKELSQYEFPPSNTFFFEMWDSYTREIPS